MILPVWAVVSGFFIVYLLVGFLGSLVVSFKSGQTGGAGLDGILAMIFICVWPLVLILLAVLWTQEKLDDLMDAIRERGARSVLPPENEHPGRRVDQP